MTYYYLAADSSTGGPETLEVLTGMVAGGRVSLATLVVPAGGEDWTPLARVLRYFYSDAAGATAGPVAFSELQRLNQTGVLDGGSWVLEEGAEQWKTLQSVITAGGAEVFVPAPVAVPEAAAVTQVSRTATVGYRPPGGRTQAVAGGDPYAAPRSGTQRVVVRHRHTGGMGRGPFFLLYMLMILIDVVALVAFIQTRFSEEAIVDMVSLMDAINQYLALILVLYFLTMVVTSILTFLRLRNTGWPVALIAVHVLMFLSIFIPANMKQSTGGSVLMMALASVALLLFALLLIIPPGFARHRRMDSTAKLNAVLVPVIAAGLIFGGYEFSKYRKRKNEERRERQLKELKDLQETSTQAK